MKNLILLTAILMFSSSCKDKPRQLSEDKEYYLETNNNVMGRFGFIGVKEDSKQCALIFLLDYHYSDTIWKKHRELSKGTQTFDLIRSGDSLFVEKKLRPNYDKYGRPESPESETHLLTIIKGEDQIDEALALQVINKTDLFNLIDKAQKITAIVKPPVKNSIAN